MKVTFLDSFFHPKSEQNHLDFGRCPNTEPTENGTEIERPRTKLVWTLTVLKNIKINFPLQRKILPYRASVSI